MEYTTLGETGMQVSRLCLGCMSFGTERGWMLSRDESKEIIDMAIDLGINFFDTANIYSGGESEEFLGEALDDYERSRSVVSTKVNAQMDEYNPNSGGLSKKAIEQELAASLDRLGMDTVDLYHIHRLDGKTPYETMLRTFDDLVRRGQVRYVGASSMWTHEFAELLHTSDRLDLERCMTMQNHYNLVFREEEREMLPFCERKSVAVIPWSPLAHGYLTRPHEQFEATTRAQTDEPTRSYAYGEYGGREINERVEELAAEKGVSMAQLSLAWLLHKDWVDAPIIGTTSVEHLEEAVEALDVKLTDGEIDYLEEPYEPVPLLVPSGLQNETLLQ